MPDSMGGANRERVEVRIGNSKGCGEGTNRGHINKKRGSTAGANSPLLFVYMVPVLGIGKQVYNYDLRLRCFSVTIISVINNARPNSEM